MNVSLTPDLKKFVQTKVDTGHYRSSSEVILEALRLLEAKDQECEQRLEALRGDIQKGFDSRPSTPLDVNEIIREAQSERNSPDHPN